MRSRFVLPLVLLAAASTARAQQAPPPVRQIASVTAYSHDTLTAVTTAVETAGGKVFVNDIIGHRVLMYDSTLAHAVIVADSDPASPNAYGPRPGTLMPFRGDSALFITPGALSMLVLNPQGQIARVMAMPPSGLGGIPALLGNIFGTPGFDAQGRLVYFSPNRPNFNFRGPPQDNQPIVMEPPDSALIVRFDFASRRLDTAGTIRIPRSHTSLTRDDRGNMHPSVTAYPPQTIDNWAVTSDGRVAILRGLDYHVDWLGTDGTTWASTGRMPFTWEHLDDSSKVHLIDSMQVAMQTLMDSMPARMARAEGGAVATSSQNGNTRTETRQVPGGGGGGMTMVFAGPGGDGPGGGGPPRQIQMQVPTAVKAAPADVPDYRPAFTQGAVQADRNGNLWIRTSTMINGRPVYDVVNGQGQLVDRVQLPQFRTIAGFGNGVIFLGVRDGDGVMHLERARVR